MLTPTDPANADTTEGSPYLVRQRHIDFTCLVLDEIVVS